jgi:hypothetical protein
MIASRPMPPAVFIARLAGPFFVVAALGMTVNRAIYAAMVAQAAGNHAIVFLSGVLALVCGLAVLNVHRAWTADWRVLVTILGWLMALGGIVRIVLPQFALRVAAAIYSGPRAVLGVAAILFLVGLFLTFQGYRKRSNGLRAP